VHFPIGLLVVYSILEVAAYVSPVLRRQIWVSPVKVFLLFTGSLSAFLALVTGGIAEELLEGAGSRSSIVETHSSVAEVTTLLYLVLAAAYFVRISDLKGWCNRIVGTNVFLARIRDIQKRLSSGILDTWLLPALALLAFIGLFVTGALGAAIVYGPNADPFVSFIYNLFWTQ